SAMLLGGLHAGLRLLTPSAMGAGDVKLAGSVGGVLGASGWGALPVAAVIAAAVTLVLVVVGAWGGRRGVRGRGVGGGGGLVAPVSDGAQGCRTSAACCRRRCC